MTHPCPAGCGPEWHHPAAEAHRVIDHPDDRPARPGHAAAANDLPPQLGSLVAEIYDRLGDGRHR